MSRAPFIVIDANFDGFASFPLRFRHSELGNAVHRPKPGPKPVEDRCKPRNLPKC